MTILFYNEINGVIYITTTSSKGQSKTYQSILLRESYREGGRVKNRTIANLTHCKPEEIAAISLAIRHKDDLTVLGSLSDDVELVEGQSLGAVWLLYVLAKRLGIEKALGTDHNGKLALWQVMARVLDQGSRLSATGLAQHHAAGDVLSLEKGFDENDLNANLHWLDEHQKEIEQRLFKARRGTVKPELFLYDVTSSYLEGEENELADYGYNRDKKRGKMQIVVGLMCDDQGEPVAVEVFKGNTPDLNTFESQIKKAAERFGCERVTFVGDRGMIKSSQIKDLSAAGFHYITAITKPQIRAMIKREVFQISLFDEYLCEIELDGVRYILRKNPVRAEEIVNTRASKFSALCALAGKQNEYLTAHPGADDFKAWKLVSDKAGRLDLSAWVRVTAKDRVIRIDVDEEYIWEIAELDGCYVIKTDLPKEVAGMETVHDRYKDLALVEMAFRTAKTGHLELRPVYVRSEESTRGQVLVLMLAYLLVRELRRCWVVFDLTVEEGLERLTTLGTMKMIIKSKNLEMHKIPYPREESARLLQAAGVKLPEALPSRNVTVVTRQNLQSRRKVS